MRGSIAVAVAVLLASSTGYARDKKRKQQETPPPPAAEVSAPQKGLIPLTVVCATPGATVYVDGEQLAITPMDLPVPVTPGDHSIKITRLGFAPYVDVFSTKGKDAVKIEMELVPVSGVLHVKSSIPGARVMVDGQYKGDAPLDIEVDSGPRAVQVSKMCFKEFFQNVMSVAGQDQSVEVTLEDLPEKDNPCRPAPAEAPRWYKKGWVWGVIAVGAAVVAGGVGVGAWAATRDPQGNADFRFPITPAETSSGLLVTNF